MKAGVPPPQSLCDGRRGPGGSWALNEGGGATPAIAGFALLHAGLGGVRSMKAGVPPPQSPGLPFSMRASAESAQ